uniref:Uncharacterized protein n=1 Tax=Oryza sativa subsp. japonica TaxID=39947 RepID=Q69XP5_ORYSJ|nr:hypothetical protein [Oryza sativa Japonica Group]
MKLFRERQRHWCRGLDGELCVAKGNELHGGCAPRWCTVAFVCPSSVAAVPELRCGKTTATSTSMARRREAPVLLRLLRASPPRLQVATFAALGWWSRYLYMATDDVVPAVGPTTSPSSSSSMSHH